MFKGCCAYCEGKFDDTSYAQIDHFKPKSLFPELCFDYNNMNYSCEKCNNYKSNKFNEKLINPSEENPEEHLKFEKVYFTSLDENGEITLNLLGINNEDRLIKKKEKYEEIRRKIEIITNVLEKIIDNFEIIDDSLMMLLNANIQDIEKSFCLESEFSTMVRHNFKNDYEYIQSIMKNIKYKLEN